MTTQEPRSVVEALLSIVSKIIRVRTLKIFALIPFQGISF